MELETLQNILNSKKKGAYISITFQKVYGVFKKTTTSVVRLVKYSSVVKKENNGNNGTSKKQRQNNSVYLGNNIVYNTNTQKTCLQVFLTKNQYHKPKTYYTEINGETEIEITREMFYEKTNKKPSECNVMFNIDIQDIIAIK